MSEQPSTAADRAAMIDAGQLPPAPWSDEERARLSQLYPGMRYHVEGQPPPTTHGQLFIGGVPITGVQGWSFESAPDPRADEIAVKCVPMPEITIEGVWNEPGPGARLLAELAAGAPDRAGTIYIPCWSTLDRLTGWTGLRVLRGFGMVVDAGEINRVERGGVTMVEFAGAGDGMTWTEVQWRGRRLWKSRVRVIESEVTDG